MNILKTRSIEHIVTAEKVIEGGGFPVRRPIPNTEMEQIDPFLLLDHLGPTNWGPGEAIGAPDHPHRGFETVTYLLAGENEHKDSKGNHGRLRPGDVQWMTAGSGVVHSELPSPEFLEKGGIMHGFQVWINLPSKRKMIPPSYQDTPSDRIPEIFLEDKKSKVRVIAGEFNGVNSVIKTNTPILFVHALLEPGVELKHHVSTDDNIMGYLISGKGEFGLKDEKKSASEGQLVVFSHDGDSISLRSTDDSNLELLILGGTPINEPMVRYGPFVMNTKEEIFQAFHDFSK
ncbi:MAG: pirin [Deltaproteobacteria bacterium]|nr:pirin [Deltaproteobacteria bacterium]|tara:strand:- start:1926 stop:2789 length:864 start_codon:yes stop_codon:yes gene_type:complete